jgi:ABC-type glycerol-3-phosphate transport system substrate-binding protein
LPVLNGVRVVAFAFVAACGGERTPPAAIRFLHTFGPEETELFNRTIAARGIAVESSLVPFARGQQVIGEILAAGTSCPDLIRIDATWLPGFVAADQLGPVPPALAGLDWLPEAIALASMSAPGDAARLAALPATVDGLVVIRDGAAPAPSTSSIDDLLSATRAAQHAQRPHPLGVRVDGYWLVPWLRAEGADLAVGKIDGSGAERAIGKFAALFGELVPPPPPAGGEAPDEIRRWTGHEVAYWVTGPWQVGALRDRERLAVSALAGAPRGGQLLVVPACARSADDGWRLAAELTAPEVQRTFAEAFATVPTRASSLALAPPLVHAIHGALRDAEPLPRSPLTPLLFDDLNPALAAVVNRDASATEAIEGVRRGWRRLAEHAEHTARPDPAEHRGHDQLHDAGAAP